MTVFLSVLLILTSFAPPDVETTVVRIQQDGSLVTQRGSELSTIRLKGLILSDDAALRQQTRVKLAQLLLRNKVVLIFDGPKESYVDKHGHFTAYVETRSGKDAGAVLLELGLAKVDKKTRFTRFDDYLRLEGLARVRNQGQWKNR